METAIGAALWVWHCIEGGVERRRWAMIAQAELSRRGLSSAPKGGWSWIEPEDLAQDTAAAPDGDLVGWFQGGADWVLAPLGNGRLADLGGPNTRTC